MCIRDSHKSVCMVQMIWLHIWKLDIQTETVLKTYIAILNILLCGADHVIQTSEKIKIDYVQFTKDN